VKQLAERALIAGLVISVFLGPAAHAQRMQPRAAVADSAQWSRKRQHDRQMEALKRESLAAYDSLRAFLGLSVQMQLARLGYGSGPFDLGVSGTLQETIREYEADRGIPVSGEPMSFWLAESLRLDESRLQEDPSLPARVLVGDAGWLRLTGAWTFAEMGEQFIAVELSCDRARRSCVEAQAILGQGMFGNVLSTDLQQWVVARWDAVEVVTEPVDFQCARYTLRINLVQETATKVRSTISNRPDCRALQREDLTITLTDGPQLAGLRAVERSRVEFPARLTPRASAAMNSRVDSAKKPE
jgi:hypothetical protein